MDEKANINEESNALLSDSNTVNNSDSSGGSNSKSLSPLQTIFGIGSAFLVVPTLVTSTVCVQLLERHIPDFELNMFRSSVPLLGSSVIWIFRPDWPVVPKSEIPGLVGYIVLAIIWALSEYTAVTFMPIATVRCVVITSALLSGFILFSLFGEEKATLRTFLCIVICATGIVMIIQPWMEFHSDLLTTLGANTTTYNRSADILSKPDLSQNVEHSTAAEPLERSGRSFLQGIFGYLLSILTGMAMSLVFLILKRNIFLAENKLTTLFWECCIGTVVSVTVTLTLEHPTLPSNWYQVFLVMGHSVSYAFLWVFYLYAIQVVSGNTLNMIACLSPIVMLIPQYTVLSSLYPGNKNWIEVVGVVLVLIGSTTGSVLEIQISKYKNNLSRCESNKLYN